MPDKWSVSGMPTSGLFAECGGAKQTSTEKHCRGLNGRL
jgi:hypothetical protein